MGAVALPEELEAFFKRPENSWATDKDFAWFAFVPEDQVEIGAGICQRFGDEHSLFQLCVNIPDHFLTNLFFLQAVRVKGEVAPWACNIRHSE